MTPRHLRRIFEYERDLFLRTYPSMPFTDVRITKTDMDFIEDRDYAYYDLDNDTVVVSRRILALPIENIVGLIRHELGHVVDPYGTEQEADDAAEIVGGEPIRYDARDVETVGLGKYPRPEYLPR